MKLEEFFPKDEIELAKKIITFFHNDCFLNKRIEDKEAIILITYMLANKKKANNVTIKDAKELFIKFSRKEKSFSNRLNEMKKSRKKEGIVVNKNNELKLDRYGLEIVKRILNKNDKKS